MRHKIMIIRHAEKHQHGAHDRGVDEEGRPAHHELTVRGWQRAGALVHFFEAGGVSGGVIQPPRAIFASNATRESPSLRAMHTVGPLADALGIEVDHGYAEGDEAALAQALHTAPSPALIAWHHSHIRALAHEIAGGKVTCPGAWPEDRFDMVWVLEHGGPHGGWSFCQVPQRLLPGDREDVF